MPRHGHAPTRPCPTAMHQHGHAPTRPCTDTSSTRPYPVTAMPRHCHAPTRPCPNTAMHQHGHAPTRPCTDTAVRPGTHAPTQPCTITAMHRHMLTCTMHPGTHAPMHHVPGLDPSLAPNPVPALGYPYTTVPQCEARGTDSKRATRAKAALSCPWELVISFQKFDLQAYLA
jgi:hypothetical protein